MIRNHKDEIFGQVLLLGICALILVVLTHSLMAQEGDPEERAKKNASEGLKAALEELQQAVGPDQRVTARASILDPNIVRPHLTGVWESWEIDPAGDLPGPGNYSPGREENFMKWLVSHPDDWMTSEMNFPYEDPGDVVTLLGSTTLGPNWEARDVVKGGKIPSTDPAGSFAWVVLDEGVKVRINTPFKNGESAGLTAEATMELGAGERAGTEFISGLDTLRQDWFDIDSPTFADLDDGLNGDDFMESLEQFTPGILTPLKRLTHDVSYYSTGLFCDVARGGLKKDFHLMTNGEGLPAEFANETVYASQLGLNNEASDPYWQYFADFANLRADSGGDIPFLQASIPNNYAPYVFSGTPLNPDLAVVGQPEGGTRLLPTIARIQFVFGIFAEPLTPETQGSDQTKTHRLNLTYKPVVTLHNPYNVALKFDDLKIAFTNLPFAVEFIVTSGNGSVLTSGLRPFDRISLSRFELNIMTPSIGGGLQPGEVRVFDAASGFQNDTFVGIKRINMQPGLNPFGGTYALDRLSATRGYIYFKQSDRIGVRVAPRAHEPWSGNRFIVTMALGDRRKAAAIEMDYQKPSGIEDAIGDNQNFPLQLDDRLGYQLIASSQAGELWPFALYSFRARTTSVGGNSVFENERHPGKPWCFAHATSGVERHRFDTSHPSDHSHAFDIQLLNSLSDANISVDPSDRGFFVSGNSPVNGVGFGALYDIPLAPIQSFSALNGADPTGVSGFLPRVAQPIGNSWAHPLIASDELRSTDPDPLSASDYLDHSFLLNLAFYDHFYFSGLADQSGEWFENPLTTSDLAGRFSSGSALNDPRLLFYRPNGKKSEDFINLIEGGPQDDAYRRVSAWQMMRGAFNVNSTSVDAWRAMLASVHDADARFLDAESMQVFRLRERSDNEARISRFRLPGSESFEDTGDPKSYWLGPREYSDVELEALAVAIVAQVRERGPFLSMGDFVNRRLTGENSDHALCGALQRAIDVTDINRNIAEDAWAGGDIPMSAIGSNPFYRFPQAAEGASYQGAPGSLSQADLLTVLGNAATVRSDTFTIRAYGESRDESGQVIGRAWCEAVVQRIPDWVDQADAADVAPNQLTSATNQSLGRRFRLIAFRWLPPEEV